MACKGKINKLHQIAHQTGSPLSGGAFVDGIPSTDILENIPVQKSTGSNFFSFSNQPTAGDSEKERYEKNNTAIQTLIVLKDDQREPTPEEQLILSQYSGWSKTMAQSSENYYMKYDAPEYIREIVNDTPGSSNIPREIVGTMWNMIEKVGANPARVLDTTLGTGEFFGYMPASLRQANEIKVGFERNSITADIAGLINPSIHIHTGDYSKSNIPSDWFDVVVGNCNLDNVSHQTSLSDDVYFGEQILESISSAKRQGFVAYLVPTSFLDSSNKDCEEIRRGLAEKADLVSAIRLNIPNSIEKTYDLVLFQRKEHQTNVIDGQFPDWVSTGSPRFDDPKFSGELRVNNYFLNHPDQAVFEKIQTTSYGVNVTPKSDPNGSIESIINELPVLHREKRNRCSACGAFMTTVCRNPNCSTNRVTSDFNPIKYGSAWMKDEACKIFRLINGETQPHPAYNTELSPRMQEKQNARLARIEALLPLREQTQIVMDLNNTGTDEELAEAITKLNDLYDAFVEEYGLLNLDENVDAITTDETMSFLLSLEANYDPEDQTAEKSSFLKQRVVKKYSPIEKADTLSEALLISIAEMGEVDFGRIGSLVGMDVDDVINQLVADELIYLTPEGKYVSADEYLSGDIYEKLDRAEQAAKYDLKFMQNVLALRQVTPLWLSADEIDFSTGAGWIPPRIVEDFFQKTFGAQLSATYNPELGEWFITTGADWKKNGKDSAENTKVYGNADLDIDGLELFKMALNAKIPTAYKDGTRAGEVVKIVDNNGTMLIRETQQSLKDAFVEFAKENYRDELEQIYNKEFGATVSRKFNGEELMMPGMNGNIQLRKHQQDAISRIVSGGNTLLAHIVGAGKSMTMIGSSMELKRLGKKNTLMHVIPNNMLGQYTSDFYQMYPVANLLTLSSEDFSSENIALTSEKLKNGDWDAIILTHSAFERIPTSPKTEIEILSQELDQLTRSTRGVSDKKQLSRVERSAERIRSKIDELKAQDTSESELYWEDIGVDQLFIDEADRYKNLNIKTRRSSNGAMPSVGVSASKRAEEVYKKVRSVQMGNMDGDGVVFATGTPISNSLVELYNMQRYLDSDYLQEKGIANFDAWANVFAETTTDLEMRPAGDGFRAVTRISRFKNVPELRRQILRFSDIQMDADTLGIPRPAVKGDKTQIVAVDQTPELQGFVEELGARAGRLQYVSTSEDNMLKITNEGRKAALDMRLIDPSIPDNPNSKVNTAVGNMLKIYQRTTGVDLPNTDGKQNLAQIVFCDLSTPKASGFNVYDDIKQKLVKGGVPENEIAFVQNFTSDEDKFRLFQNVNKGKVRFLIGSTETMGAGTNVQERLVALHHLDSPWRPRDIQQREGRIIRQKNKNPEVELYQYVTQGSFDTYSWQLLERKINSSSQVMISNDIEVTDRRADDIDAAVFNYGEIKAIASGSPLLTEQVETQQSIRKLESSRKAFVSRQQNLTAQLEKYQFKLTEMENNFNQKAMAISSIQQKKAQIQETIAKGEAKVQQLKSMIADGGAPDRPVAKLQNELWQSEKRLSILKRPVIFSMADGTFTNKPEAIIKGIDRAETEIRKNPNPNIVQKCGEYMGFPVQMKKVNGVVSLEISLGEKIAPITFSQGATGRIVDVRRPENSLQKIIGKVAGLEVTANRYKSESEKLARETTSIRNALQVPYKHQAEYDELAERLKNIESELSMINRGGEGKSQIIFEDEFVSA